MSTEYININKDISQRDMTFSIWKRILNNLPHIYKTKGTKRSIRSLISCYGIPSTLLQIREYGGLDVDDDVYTEYKFDNYSYALNFHGNQSIGLGWHTSSENMYPSSIEFRYIGTSSNSYILNKSMSLLEAENSWSLQIVSTSGSYGYIKFSMLTDSITYETTSSNEILLFDNKPTTIILQRSNVTDTSIDQTYSIYARKYIYGNIYYNASASLFVTASKNIAWNTDSNLYIGGNNQYAQKLSGSIDEFRLYNNVLSDFVINNHVKYPQSILGSVVTASFDDTVLRFSFDNPKNHYSGSVTSSTITNEAPLKNYNLDELVFNNWSNENTFPYSYKLFEYESEAHFINVGSTRRANKVIIDNNVILSGNLNPYSSVEISTYDKDYLSSNLIGIYWSPTDMVNEDIIKTLHISSIGDIIGDPSDFYSSSYSQLDSLRNLYWNVSSSPTSFETYLEYIKYYDNSLFENIKQLLPVRCDTILGISYEPNILERNKIEHKLPNITDQSVTQSNNLFFTSSIVTDYSLDSTIIFVTESFNINGDLNFSKTNIYKQLTISSYYESTGSYTEQISPLVDFDSGAKTTEAMSLRWNDIQTFSTSTGYHTRHYIRHEGFGTWEKRLKYIGSLQTRLTTTDGKDPIETSYADPNKLVVRDVGNTKLQVE